MNEKEIKYDYLKHIQNIWKWDYMFDYSFALLLWLLEFHLVCIVWLILIFLNNCQEGEKAKKLKKEVGL